MKNYITYFTFLAIMLFHSMPSMAVVGTSHVPATKKTTHKSKKKISKWKAFKMLRKAKRKAKHHTGDIVVVFLSILGLFSLLLGGLFFYIPSLKSIGIVLLWIGGGILGFLIFSLLSVLFWIFLFSFET